jgi:protocatechuate 3,4-dioxygenase beta subunit
MPIFAALCLAGAVLAGCSHPAPERPVQDSLPSVLTIAGPGEPGERLVVHGRVLAADGRTPLPGVRVFVYHTDAEGRYTRDERNDPNEARLNGWLRTDAEGRYEVRTIRPAHYPNGTVPAHVHYRVQAPGGGEERFELRFLDDPLLGADEIAEAVRDGDFAEARPVERGPAGEWRTRKDLRLRHRPGGN